MKDDKNLAFKDLISESLARDLILFSLLYIILIAQVWDDVFLLLFPLTTFCFAFFFKILDILKHKNQIESSHIVYNPLGSEKIISNRLNFCALLQVILLFWFGAESLYHPQLIDNYYLYFIYLLVFLYTFGFFWIFIDIGKYSMIKIVSEENISVNSEKKAEDIGHIISLLKMKNFKIFYFINLLVFITLNLLNIIFVYLTYNKTMLGIQYNLPGTGIENSNPIMLSYFIYCVFALPPSIATIFFIENFKIINTIDQKKLDEIVIKLPENIRKKVMNNLLILNKNLKDRLRLE
jgi:hypothetical protein